MTDQERRQSSRVPFEATISLHFADNHHYDRYRTADLSLKGVSVPGLRGHQVGEKCAVELFLSGGTSEVRLEMQGEVIRAGADGLALHFVAIDLDSFFHLKNIIAYNLGNPDQVEDEFSRLIDHAE
ncbi:MAG: PilZ domain-containing protein [Desulfurivibrio sp.]|nr:PilZ domain-containing protein [Desulfurivibrio sp.]